jgi:hypothetical protein
MSLRTPYFYFPLNIITQRGMKWSERDMRNAHRILIAKPEGQRPLGETKV